MTDRRKASGFVRVMERAGGPVFYALIRTADGRRLQRQARSCVGASGVAHRRGT